MKDNMNHSLFTKNLSLRKQFFYHRKVKNMITKLKNSLTDKQAHKKLSLSLIKSTHLENLNKQNFPVVYIIHFFFSPVNTFFYVTDSSGNLKARYSAGSMGFKGKQKRSRLQVLNSFFIEIWKLKKSVLKNKSISVNFNNVGSYKYFIIKNLKSFFIIKFLKNYQTHAYNGCRKKKRLRKK
jgi:ribosomal protein S11